MFPACIADGRRGKARLGGEKHRSVARTVFLLPTKPEGGLAGAAQRTANFASGNSDGGVCKIVYGVDIVCFRNKTKYDDIGRHRFVK